MDNEKQKKENRSGNKGGYSIKRLQIKQQAIEEFERGMIPMPELLSKYQICQTTFWNWKRQVKKGFDPLFQRPRHSEELKLRVVKEIITGQFTAKEASTHYDLKKSTVDDWCAKYSCQISDYTESMANRKAKKGTHQDDQLRQLERALEEANLKIIGLETMINIAEKDLKIDIRKKSGTKQSK